jgi:hypothetical protein
MTRHDTVEQVTKECLVLYNIHKRCSMEPLGHVTSDSQQVSKARGQKHLIDEKDVAKCTRKRSIGCKFKVLGELHR